MHLCLVSVAIACVSKKLVCQQELFCSRIHISGLFLLSLMTAEYN